jgi:hypothetical protein
MFSSRYSNLIGQWCIDHHRKYGKAPNRDITGYFLSWADNGNSSKEDVRSIEELLSFLSDEDRVSESPTVDYLVDLAGRVFNKARLLKLCEQVKDKLDSGDDDGADALISAHRRVELGMGSGVALLNDKEAILSTFREDAGESLINYPGALGKFFKGQLQRDAFVGVMAPQKTGKSWWLTDMAWRALLGRFRVAYFQVGDLTERQVKERIVIRVSGKPVYSPSGKWPMKVDYPTSIRVPEPSTDSKPMAEVSLEKMVFSGPLSGIDAWHDCERFVHDRLRTNRILFRLFYCPTLGINVDGVKDVLETWAAEGWVADVVLIDYADNLAPPNGDFRERRDQVEQTWARMRQISETLHCLVVTATQVNKEAYSAWVMNKTHFAADNRKFNHVTGMIGLNQTGKEKEANVMRLNWIALRSGAFSVFHCCHVAGCLALARPAVLSAF